MATQAIAPWFFRKRFALFGAVYGVAFLGGYALAAVLGMPTAPAFATARNPGLVSGLAVAFVVAGYLLRLWASSYISASIVWTQDIQKGDLRISGPYRFTRNPLYLGNILQAIGVGTVGPWPVEALLVPLIVAYTYVLVGVEEPFLARENGAGYERYRALVGRLIPIPGKIAPDGGQPYSIAAGFRSELMTLGFALYLTAFVAIRTFRP